MTEIGMTNGQAGENIVPVVIEVQTLPAIKGDALANYIKENRADGNLKAQFHVRSRLSFLNN